MLSWQQIRPSSALGLCAAVLALVCGSVSAQNQSAVGSRVSSPRQRMEEKARLLQPYDSKSVRDLAAEVLHQPHCFPPVPSALEPILEDRLVQAEMDYLQGAAPGVQERDIARLANKLMDKIGAPSYASTSEHQVRALRLITTILAPQFMGRGMVPADIRPGESINPAMSPLQAVHLLAVLIDQKLANPDYQLEPQDWEKSQNAKSLERWRAYRESISSGVAEPPPTKGIVATRVNPKRKEMLIAASRYLSSMSVGDALDLLDEAFSTLRIGEQ